ncbi:cytochrome c3 family protein [Thermodesulfatator atlanticus]|uniref:cytochrome c3 family protein n=1 Tax=Thermodesulfatator atlanticus TaxID=501497 RepID=UPI0003B4D5A9|nr:cytochrome c3 family protein [Thermodesulfatator atlanticus]
MKKIYLTLFILLSIVFSSNSWASEYPTNDVCFKCHKKEQFLKGKSIHQPVKNKRCDKCHRPHASKYKKLLLVPEQETCTTCHKKLESKILNSKFAHDPALKNHCIRCHNPHSSKYNFLLNSSVQATCKTCHKKILTKKYQFVHKPYKDGNCLKCHNPHYSNDPRLLKKNPNQTCFSCHKKDNKLLKAHNGKTPKGECLLCHNPHGSNNKALLRPIKHKPFAAKNCKACHAQNAPKDEELCLQCHKDNLKTFQYTHNHLLGGYTQNTCLVCHNPHVAETKDLLVASPEHLCSSCHTTVYKQKREMLYFHPKRKFCLECHKAHGSNHPAMLRADGNKVCSRCHETQGKFSHPVGEKVLDPRNKQPMTCITCHEPMGTNYKYQLKMSGEAALCLECHKNY